MRISLAAILLTLSTPALAADPEPAEATDAQPPEADFLGLPEDEEDEEAVADLGFDETAGDYLKLPRRLQG